MEQKSLKNHDWDRLTKLLRCLLESHIHKKIKYYRSLYCKQPYFGEHKVTGLVRAHSLACKRGGKNQYRRMNVGRPGSHSYRETRRQVNRKERNSMSPEGKDNMRSGHNFWIGKILNEHERPISQS